MATFAIEQKSFSIKAFSANENSQMNLTDLNLGPYKRTQTVALRHLPQRRRSRRGAKVDEASKRVSSTAATIYIAAAVDEPP